MPAVRAKVQTAVKMELGRDVGQACCCAHGGLDLMTPRNLFLTQVSVNKPRRIKLNPGMVSGKICKANMLTLLVPRAVDTAHIQRLGAGRVQVMLRVAESSSAPTTSSACIMRPDWWQEGHWSPCWVAFILQQEEVLCKPASYTETFGPSPCSLMAPAWQWLKALWCCYPGGKPQGQPSSTLQLRYTYKGKSSASMSVPPIEIQYMPDNCVRDEAATLPDIQGYATVGSPLGIFLSFTGQRSWIEQKAMRYK